MKRAITSIILPLILLLLPGLSAFAAVDEPRVDRSSIYVWAFIGICAFIVAAQLFPLLRDALKGTEGKKEEMGRKTITT
jgi:hypothetical protein